MGNDRNKEKEKKGTCVINIFGAGIEASFEVHKNVPFKIGKELGEEHKSSVSFLDRGDEPGKCLLFGRNSLLVKRLLTEEEYKKELEYEELEMGYYRVLEEREEARRIKELKDKIEQMEKESKNRERLINSS